MTARDALAGMIDEAMTAYQADLEEGRQMVSTLKPGDRFQLLGVWHTVQAIASSRPNRLRNWWATFITTDEPVGEPVEMENLSGARIVHVPRRKFSLDAHLIVPAYTP